jgi:4-amino-4-deoxy-L-arabinose transferase-like glycosyltransferase
MKNGINHFKGIHFYILVAGIFLLIISHSFLSDGMFMDGLMYATISKNLSAGIGTFWQPHMTETFFPVFVNHPPLAFGLESVFFRILGVSRYVERFYSVLAIAVTACIIVSIWKSLGKKSSTGWLPLFLWIAIPSVTWTAVNNMLENTMGIFICLSVLFYIKSRTNKWSDAFVWFPDKGFCNFLPAFLPILLLVIFKKNYILVRSI